jgi:hypothetical protein
MERHGCTMTIPPNTRVWRYMSFAKMVWILQNKQLWLSSAELLDDKWELMPLEGDLGKMLDYRPPTVSPEAAQAHVADIVRTQRKQTFVNCWTASEHESHALWRIYCPSSEGVAMQTTLDRLRRSLPLPVIEVSYDSKDGQNSLPDVAAFVARKRPMFAYEQEVRIVLIRDLGDPQHPGRRTIGAGIEWDPEKHVENIWVHPEAPFWFMETVTETVRQLAPALSYEGTPRVWWSAMNASPPF